MKDFLTLFIAALLGSILGYIYGHHEGWLAFRAVLEEIGENVGTWK